MLETAVLETAVLETTVDSCTGYYCPVLVTAVLETPVLETTGGCLKGNAHSCWGGSSRHLRIFARFARTKSAITFFSEKIFFQNF